jgi:hypothetical protein
MTEHSGAAVAGITSAPGARLEPDAIGAAQDTVIGMASSAPAATVVLTFAALAATVVLTFAGAGIILMACARLILRSAFFRLPRESEAGRARLGEA